MATEETKVKQLIGKLEKFHWSKRLPEHCVMPNGKGLGNFAYMNMSAFNVAWAFHKPETDLEHEAACVTFLAIAEHTKEKYSHVSLGDAVMLLSKPAFEYWLETRAISLDSRIKSICAVASENRETV